jgi:biopolymer transport protein TolR
MAGGINLGGGGGRRKGRRRANLMTEINVTPFVDVMLVLLIIFMVAAPLLQSGVQVDLPSAKGQQIDAPKTEPLVVSITKAGDISLGQAGTTIRIEELADKLRAIAGSRGGFDEPIFVYGDEGTEYRHVARVMARIKEAGFKKLSLVTKTEQGG